MNRLILPYIFILSCILCACQDIDDIPTQAGKVDADIISLNVTVADNITSGNPASRTINHGKSTFFEPGDSVGVIVLDKDGNFIVNNALFFLNDNYKWTFQGENVPLYDSEMQTYIVYFPYHESVTAKECKSAEEILSLPAFNHHEDQTSKAAYRNSDVMAWESSDGPFKDIKAELRHLRNCVSLDITVQWELLTGEKITFKNPNEAAIRDNEGKLLKTYQAEDGTFRYILPDGYEGDIAYFYNYRESMFKGLFNVQSSETGILYSRFETVDMNVYTFDKVIVGDFYCKNSENYGFILPYEATEYLDDDNHRCIGLVFFIGQNENDGVEYEGSYDYSETGIEDSSCHGYVLALTDVQNDLNNMFEWELDNNYDPYEGEEIRTRMGANVYSGDWGGYHNTLKILDTCKDNEWYKNFYPAAYAAYYYGNLATGTVEVTYEENVTVKKTILFNSRDNTPSDGVRDELNPYEWQEPLQAPDNTSGWYLPGNGMLLEIRQHQFLFEQRYEEIKRKLADEVPYKEHIGWIKYVHNYRGAPYYWSSTESNYEGRALSHEYSIENNTYPSHKSKAFAVRAVLSY
ncbi:MAG: fimbrillin family protein [Muribaculaceae bacterium]|nr:fimbrillin family protein [Muribaculaceae bacterium]